MPIVHIVLFQFGPRVELEDIRTVCRNMLGLQAQCLHPQHGKPYILSSSGGRDTSPEGHQVGGFSHGFVSTFENEDDRRYYLEEDPAHLAFVKGLEGKVVKVRVVDYSPGVY